MAEPYSFGSAVVSLAKRVAVLCLAVGCLAHGQIFYPNHEIQISDLPSLTAKSKDAPEVLATSLQVIFRDEGICCGKDSALEDSLQRANPTSLKDVGEKLRGRQRLSDGRSIMITAEVWPAAPGSASTGGPISEIMEKRALLMEWNSRWYVVYGATYGDIVDSDGNRSETILKLWLMDTRYSDERRKVIFDRQTDNWAKVQGLLILRVKPN
jgi:hypothetical protein